MSSRYKYRQHNDIRHNIWTNNLERGEQGQYSFHTYVLTGYSNWVPYFEIMSNPTICHKNYCEKYYRIYVQISQ